MTATPAVPDTAPEPPALQFDTVSVTYPGPPERRVGPLTLTVRGRERVLLLGPSGCGKSSFLAAATGLIPTAVPAEVTGRIALYGRAATDRPPAAWVDTVGFLHQNPEQMVCGFRVGDEIGFAAESLALPEAEIDRRVADAMARLGLPADLVGRRVATLSGGERQQVALAGLFAAGAPVTAVDEPTASLSPGAADRVRRHLFGPDRPGPILTVDHRLDGLIDRIDRVAVLDMSGRPWAEGTPEAVFSTHAGALAEMGIWQPLASRLAVALRSARLLDGDTLPLTAEALLSAVAMLPTAQRRAAEDRIRAALASGRGEGRSGAAPSRGPTITLEGAICRAPAGPPVLNGIDFALYPGEVTALVGANGAGKTSLALALAGAIPLAAGRRTGPRAAMILQNPEAHLNAPTVRDRLTVGRSAASAETELARWGLAHRADAHPFTLSEGEKRRLAVAAVLAETEAPAVVLDEPTAGLDSRGADRILRLLRGLADAGRAVLAIGHDLDALAAVADRAVVLGPGGILVDGPSGRVFADPAPLAEADLRVPDRIRLLAGLGDR